MKSHRNGIYSPHNITFAGNLSRFFPKAGAPRFVFRARGRPGSAIFGCVWGPLPWRRDAPEAAENKQRLHEL